MKIEILSSTPLTMAEVKANITHVKQRDGELNFRAAKTEEYLSAFHVLDEKKATSLYKKLEELSVPRLKDIHYVKIIDLLPTTIEQLKMILQGYTLTVTNENLKKIVTLVNEYAKE